jgi:hypothetical protein
VIPDGKERAISRAFDEGGGAKRILVAAGMLDPAAGIVWIHGDARDAVHMIPAIPADHLVCTVVAPGHPSEAERQPKSPPRGRGCRANEWLFGSADQTDHFLWQPARAVGTNTELGAPAMVRSRLKRET